MNSVRQQILEEACRVFGSKAQVGSDGKGVWVSGDGSIVSGYIEIHPPVERGKRAPAPWGRLLTCLRALPTKRVGRKR